ncbi:hypothetical protein SUGI_0291260 [Cryptomeria japonica]|nr:hypothetical protein SUGI_0291260 [Cryptomeria japonica]
MDKRIVVKGEINPRTKVERKEKSLTRRISSIAQTNDLLDITELVLLGKSRMEAKSTSLVLMGRTGNGKSSTGNSILERNDFKSIRSFRSVTKECKMAQSTWKDGRILNVIDTPGLFDTNVPKEVIDKEIVKCINLAKDGIHGVLFVLSLKNRFTAEEAEAMDNLEMLFGPTIVNYMVIIFTGGDELENSDRTFEDCMEEFPTNLKRIINRCNSRMVVFNNHKSASATVKENQITELLKQVDCIVADNENQPYSNELFAKAQMMTSQLFHIKDKEKIYAEQIKQLNEMMERNMRAMEERMRAVTAELETQLESARSARMKAESEAESVKHALEVRIMDLEKQLQAERQRQREREQERERERGRGGGRGGGGGGGAGAGGRGGGGCSIL